MNTNDQALKDVQAIINMFVEALKFDDLQLSGLCISALGVLGPPALGFMERTVANQGLSHRHLEKVRAAIAQISDEPSGLPQAGELVVFRAIMDSLRVARPMLNARALEAVKCLPPKYINHIITLALINRSKPSYCARLLSALRMIDSTPDASSRFNLCILRGHTNPAVAAKAGEAIVRFAPAHFFGHRIAKSDCR